MPGVMNPFRSSGPRFVLYVLLLVVLLTQLVIWGTNSDIGPFANLLAGSFGIFLAAIVTSYIVEWVGRTGQKRQWEREWRTQNVERIYGPLYNDLVKNAEGFADLKYYNGSSREAWDVLSKNYLFLAIPQRLRGELEDYFGEVRRVQELKSRLWKVLARISDRIHQTRFTDVGGNPSPGALLSAITGHLMDCLYRGDEPPDTPEGGWSPYFSEFANTRTGGGSLDWRSVYREIRDEFRATPDFHELKALTSSLKLKSEELKGELDRIIQMPSETLRET